MLSTECRNEQFLIITHVIYVVEGLLIIICNGMVELAFIKNQNLRRQYIILFAQNFADTAVGLGYFLAGIGRLIIIRNGCFRTSRRSCFLLPWSAIIPWSTLLSAISTLMVSTDRIISLVSPVRYFHENYSYQIKQIIFYFGSASLFILIACYFSFSDAESMLNGFCWSGDVLQPFYADLHGLLQIIFTSLGVILYVLVYLLSRKHLRRIKNNQSESSLQLFETRQRKLTITMGISCVFTLIFYVIPVCSKLLIYDSDDDPTTYYSELLRVTVSISCNLNPLTNVAAILIKQDDIASQVRQLLPKCIPKSVHKCKQATVACRKNVSTIFDLRINHAGHS